MTRVRSNDSVVVAWLDRFSPNFEEGVRIQAELTKQNVGIVAIKEGINTTDDSAAAKLFRRMMLAKGAYQVESTSERIKTSLERSRAEGRKPARPPSHVSKCRNVGGCTLRIGRSVVRCGYLRSPKELLKRRCSLGQIH